MAAELFRRAQAKELQLVTTAVIVLEVFNVLTKVYAILRPDAARILNTLLASGACVCEDGSVCLDALQRITANKISFGDAYLAASAAKAKEEVVTFDKGMAVFKDIRFYPLNALSKSAGK